MGLVAVLGSHPAWWYESWGPERWVQTLFNQPLEVHTFVLGALVGVALATLAVARNRRMALALTLLVIVFTFGGFESISACRDTYTACAHVQVKPWYFIGGYVVSSSLARGVARLVRTVTPSSAASSKGADRLATAVVLALVAFGVYSFVSPRPVHPITGLSTFGGVLGAAGGRAVYAWTRADDGDGPTFGATTRRVLGRELDESVLVIAYGTTLGFGYPRLFWELGRLLGREGFLFGSLLRAQTGVVSVVPYVLAVFLVSLGVLWHRRSVAGTGATWRNELPALVIGHVVWGSCLFLATGVAGSLWARVFAGGI
jgi:hypothetical protein